MSASSRSSTSVCASASATAAAYATTVSLIRSILPDRTSILELSTAPVSKRNPGAERRRPDSGEPRQHHLIAALFSPRRSDPKAASRGRPDSSSPRFHDERNATRQRQAAQTRLLVTDRAPGHPAPYTV